MKSRFLSIFLILTLGILVSCDFPQWAGIWKGTMMNYPNRSSMKPMPIEIELGPFPSEDGSCSIYRTSYFPPGEKVTVKDYRWCRGNGEDDLYLDEGRGVHLKARLINDIMVTPIKVGSLVLISNLQMFDDILQEDIFLFDDLTTNKSIDSLIPNGLQRLTTKRVSN